MVDGVFYFDLDRDAQMRKDIAQERNRLIQKMIGEKRKGGTTQYPQPSYQILMTCGDHAEKHDDLITIDSDELNENQ